jgi:transglutaminase-like putative cysteine protease
MAQRRHPNRLPQGDSGTRATLLRMRQLVNNCLFDPKVRDQAHAIIRQSRAKDYSGQALAIREWASDHFMFVRDAIGIEMLRSPADMVRQLASRPIIQGDCDDAAVLTATLGKVVGMRAKFTAVAFIDERTPFTHVYTWLWTHEGWRDMDITRTEAGTTNYGPKRVMTQEV